MSWEENKEFTESKLQVEPDPPKSDSLLKKTWKYVVVGVVCFIIGFSIPTNRADNLAARNRELVSENHELKKDLKNQQPVVTVLVPTPVPTSDNKTAPVADVPATKSVEPDNSVAQKNDVITEDAYISNDYFEVVETATLKNTIGYTEMVHKVLAKKNVSVSSTVLVYSDDDNSVLEKTSDDIVLTEGEYNYFHYSFQNDVSNAGLKITANVSADSFMIGKRDAVEMVQYNQNGDYLYITFKQIVDDLDYFSKYKLLFYKDDKIIDTDDGYFSTHAENLKSNGDTDVAEIRVRGIDYDRFEYIFEP